MKTTRVLVLTLAVLCPIVATAQIPGEPQAPDLQGTWRLLSVEHAGKKTVLDNEESYLPGRLIISGDTFTYSIGEEKVAHGTLRIDAKCSPQAVDATGTYLGKGGPFIEWTGIYKIEGDRLWLCGRLAGGSDRPPPPERPTEFKAAWGDLAVLALLRRERP
jgi:uncharacterized protein (TIGR03067 family)